MMNQKELMEHFDQEFDKVKKEVGFSQSLNELDIVFFIRDRVCRDGYVSSQVSRVISSAIAEQLLSWSNYYHSLLIPNPQNINNVEESNMLSDEQKNELSSFMNKVMDLVSLNSLAGLKKDKVLEKEFIDSSYDFWTKEFAPALAKTMEQVNSGWKEKVKTPQVSEKQVSDF